MWTIICSLLCLTIVAIFSYLSSIFYNITSWPSIVGSSCINGMVLGAGQGSRLCCYVTDSSLVGKKTWQHRIWLRSPRTSPYIHSLHLSSLYLPVFHLAAFIVFSFFNLIIYVLSPAWLPNIDTSHHITPPHAPRG